MLGAIYIGLSGMETYSNGLRQVSSNITNLNSNGYKGTSVGFRDIANFSTLGSGARLGSNSSGSGVSLSPSRVDFSQGELRQSNRELDLAVDGDGFLLLERDGEFFYTRTGSFERNDDGFFVLVGTDYRLMNLPEGGDPEAFFLDDNRISPPTATTNVTFTGGLLRTDDNHVVSNISIFDEEGEESVWTVDFIPVGEEDSAQEWTMTITDADSNIIGTDILKFFGRTVDFSTETFTFSDDSGRSVIFDFKDVVSDFGGVNSTLAASEVDGYGVGEIASVSITDEGVFELIFTNEQTEDLGTIAMARVQDLQNLTQLGAAVFQYEGKSAPRVHKSTDDEVGRILSRRVEASNVDLSAQFGDLILVQRGYQASSQVVSVTNDMIQQLFGLRGQG